MKITGIETMVVDGPVTEIVFVRVATDEGPSGLGECTLPGKAHGVVGAVRDMEKLLIGADPCDIQWCWQRMYKHSYWRGGPILTSSISGIDIALWDVLGQTVGLPVYKLLGGAVRERISLYANIGLSEDPEELARRAESAFAAGYRYVKFYPLPAMGPTLTSAAIGQVVTCAEAVRRVAGTNRDFALDFHGRTNAAQAIALEHALRDTRPLWIEEPVAPEVADGLGKCMDHFKTPLALGERLFTRWAFTDHLAHRRCDIIQPDIANAGGISELLVLSGMADAFGVVLNPHNPNGPVQSMATMHICARAPAFSMMEHRGDAGDAFAAMVDNVPRVEDDGALPLPRGAGLGVALRPDLQVSTGDCLWYPECFTEDGTPVDW